jgi:hypothetical protein
MKNMILVQAGPCKLIPMTIAAAAASARKAAANKAAGKLIDEPVFAATVKALAAKGVDYATYEPTQEDIKAPSHQPTRRPVNPARMVAAMDYAAGDINNLLRSCGNAACAE